MSSIFGAVGAVVIIIAIAINEIIKGFQADARRMEMYRIAEARLNEYERLMRAMQLDDIAAAHPLL